MVSYCLPRSLSLSLSLAFTLSLLLSPSLSFSLPLPLPLSPSLSLSLSFFCDCGFCVRLPPSLPPYVARPEAALATSLTPRVHNAHNLPSNHFAASTDWNRNRSFCSPSGFSPSNFESTKPPPPPPLASRPIPTRPHVSRPARSLVLCDAPLPHRQAGTRNSSCAT